MSPTPEMSPPPPSPAPEMPGTTFEELPAKEVTITITLAGTVETFNTADYESGMRAYLGCNAPLCEVVIAVTAASVNVAATVTDTTGNVVNDNAESVVNVLKTLDQEALQAALSESMPEGFDLTVESIAAVSPIRETTLTVAVAASPSAPPASKLGGEGLGQEKESNQETTDDAGLGAGLGIGLGLPIFCVCLFFLHVQMNFAAGNRGKYLRYRFSHTNAMITCGYIPKESRDAMWAELKAPAGQSGQEVTAAKKDEKMETI